MKNIKKHIVIIADPIDKQLAGIHYFTLNLIEHLLAQDKHNKYSIIKLNPNPISEKVNHISLPNTIEFLRNDPIRTFFTLPRLIRKLKPDIVIEPAHFGPFNLPKRIKRITYIHDLTPIKYPKYHPLASVIAHKLIMPRIIRKADLLLTNSKNTTEDLIHYFPKAEGKVETIYLGKGDLFKPSISESILEKYKIRKPYFFSIGTIEPRKNLICLLEAYRLFRTSYRKKVDLVIAGEFGWKSERFYKRFLKHPFKEDIKLIGHAKRADLPFLYSQADAFIYPSFYEGFGLPVAEAMACGTVSILSNSSSLPEVGGDAAIYFNPNSPLELKEIMIELYENENLMSLLEEKAIKQAQKFSWEKFAKTLMQLLDKEIQNS